MTESRVTTLIDPDDLSWQGSSTDWAIVDCRFSLADPAAGRRAYQERHIPGAVYAHLDEDLSGPIVPGVSGRHPLPSIHAFVATLSRWGIDDRVQVVAYDDSGGAIAARLWWMLRWLGHEAVAVLNGGFPTWLERGYPTTSGRERRPPRVFTPRPHQELFADAETVARIAHDPSYRVVDARGADRYRGENETIDPVAGHIPGAISLPYAANLRPDKTFRPAHELRKRFTEVLGEMSSDRVVCYCGSGVTACHNLLAMVHAGMGEAKLYAGSWSEWITDPNRPVATGET